MDDDIRVYEVHGDLLFAGAEQVLRSVDRDSADFAAVILDVSRLDSVNDPARSMLLGLSTQLGAEGKAGFLVDPDRRVIPTGHPVADLCFPGVDDAVAAARAWLQSVPTG